MFYTKIKNIFVSLRTIMAFFFEKDEDKTIYNTQHAYPR